MIKQLFFSFILTLFLVSFSFGQNDVPFYSIGQKIHVGNAYLTILGIQKSSKSFSDDYVPAKGNILLAVNIEIETINTSSANDAFQSTQITGNNGIYFPTAYGVKKPILEDFSSTLQKTQFWQTFEIPIKETNLTYLYQAVDFKLISFTLNSQSKAKTSKPPIVWDKDNEPMVISRAETSQRRTTLKPKSTPKITKKVDAKPTTYPKVATVQIKPVVRTRVAKRTQLTKTEMIETQTEEPIAVAPVGGIYRIGQRIPSGDFILSLIDWEIKPSSYTPTYQVPKGRMLVSLKVRLECLNDKYCDIVGYLNFSKIIGNSSGYEKTSYGRREPELKKVPTRTIKRGDRIWYEKIGWETFEVNSADSNFVFSYLGSKEFKITLSDSYLDSTKPAPIMTSIQTVTPRPKPTPIPMVTPMPSAQPTPNPVNKFGEKNVSKQSSAITEITQNGDGGDSHIELSKRSNAEIRVSGIVPTQRVKNEIYYELQKTFGYSIDVSGLEVKEDAKDTSWLPKFYEILPSLVSMSWNSGSLFISAKVKRYDGMPAELRSKISSIFLPLSLQSVVGLDKKNELTKSPKASKQLSDNSILKTFKVKYGNLSNSQAAGSLIFDDENKEIVFQPKNGINQVMFGYSLIKTVVQDNESKISTAGSIISSVPITGANILGSSLKKKTYFVRIAGFKSTSTADIEIITFRVESKNASDEIVQMINERIKRRNSNDKSIRQSPIKIQ